MNFKVEIDFINKRVLTKKEIEDVEEKLSVKFPPILKYFYQNYCDLIFDETRLFEPTEKMGILSGDSDLEVSVYQIMNFENIKRIYKTEKEEPQYSIVFEKYWMNYIPIISPMGDNGYFLVGKSSAEEDKIIYLNYTENIIIKVCANIFVLINNYFQKY